MNYELAKELKEAGFPKAAFKVPEIDPARPESKEVWGLPTLEELISAIPIPDEDVGFISISLIRGEWYAGYEKYEVFDPECSGATPLEAVAKLWLTLQQKSV